MKKLLKGLLAAVLAAGMLSGFAYSAPAAEQTEPSVSEQLVVPQSTVFLPKGMRAAALTPGVDFAAGDTTDEALSQELPALFEELSGYGMNTVIINTDHDGERYYDLDMSSGRGILGTMLDKAHDYGFFAYIQLDVNSLLAQVEQSGGGLKNGFSAAAHRFVMKYACDGIILNNYYTADTQEMYARYMKSGSGIGYENWLYETNEYIIRTMSEVIRRTDSGTAVGLLITDMWANYTSNENGSVTADTFEALYDGFCDTKRYAEQGYIDFTMVKAYGTDIDYRLPFESVVSWWDKLAQQTGTAMYVLHLNERVGVYDGWYADQLLRQLTIMQSCETACGSCFNSLAALRANTSGSTDTLKKFFNDMINPDSIFDTLKMTMPTQTNFVTYDSTVKFMGTFDENFDVFFDGEKLTLNEAGNFYLKKELKVGSNSFMIEHKGKQIKYNIERKVDVLKSIEITKDLTVEGGSEVTLEAVAYRGSKVSASVGDKYVNLKESAGASEDIDANSDYVRFVGKYTVPEGIIGSAQPLGNISYYAVYKGIEEYMTGGSITVAAKPEPPKEIQVVEITEGQSSGSSEVVGTISPVVSAEEYVTYIKTLNNYTTVLDSKTTGKTFTPTLSQLPAGTLDYYRSTSGDYIIGASGRRYFATDVKTFTDTGLGENKLLVKSIGNKSGNSFIKLHLDYKITFNVNAPVAFHEQNDGSYGVAYYNADRVEIVFDNVTSVTQLPDFDNCSLFSSGAWDIAEINGIPCFRLTLKLRQAGIYSGCAAYYDENGDLVISFNVPTATLSGKVIVIDPGHGYNMSATVFDPGAVGNVTEQSVNLAVAKLLEQKLTAMGATVVRLKTESEFIYRNDRPIYARNYGADMFISLHCNALSDAPNAHGTEAYYFTPYSQPLAKYVTENISKYLDTYAYGDGTQSSRGEKYSYYWVTLQQDFPSILVEMGFVTNDRECLILADSTHQNGIAQAIADGVKSYFTRSGLSYAGSGSSDVNLPENPTDEPQNPTDEPQNPTDEPQNPTDEPQNPTDEPQNPTDEPETPVTNETENPVTNETEAPVTNEPTVPTEEAVTGETDSPELPIYEDGGGIRVD